MCACSMDASSTRPAMCVVMCRQQQLQRHLAFEHCYRLSLERAVMQIDVPQLMAMYQSDTAAPTDRG